VQKFIASHKWHIVNTINQQFHAINEQMGPSEQPHENMKMYLHTLSIYLKSQKSSSATPEVAAMMAREAGLWQEGNMW